MWPWPWNCSGSRGSVRTQRHHAAVDCQDGRGPEALLLKQAFESIVRMAGHYAAELADAPAPPKTVGEEVRQ
jgi:hypothetical protein